MPRRWWHWRNVTFLGNRGVQNRAGQGPHRRAEPVGSLVGELGQDRLALQCTEQEVGDQLGVGLGPLRGDERADGPDADSALVGTRVAVLLEDAYADHVVADASWLFGVPEGLDAGVASMLPTAGAVSVGLLRTGRLTAGETVLVTAGAGGIGHLAVQLANRQGAGTVIATAGSQEKRDLLKELGADAAVDHTRPDWADRVRAAAPGGVDLALDAIGGAILHQSIALLAPFGRAIVYGASAGDWTSVPVVRLAALKTISGFSLLAWRAADPERARADVAELAGLFATGGLRAVAETRLPLAEVVEAHRRLEDRTVLGRLILTP